MSGRFKLCLLVALLSAAGECAADEIRVAVATNFVGAMNALVARFEATSGHTVLVSSGSTGGHYAQIKNGAPFEAFFAADTERPRLLESEGVTVPGSRFLYAVGRVALWSARTHYVDADGKVLETGDFLHLAIANPELAPYGLAAQQTLTALGLWNALQPRIVRGQSIAQTFAMAETQNADLAFVALSQVVAYSGTAASYEVPAELHAPLRQDAVLLVRAEHNAAARAFLEFLASDAAARIIERHGYSRSP